MSQSGVDDDLIEAKAPARQTNAKLKWLQARQMESDQSVIQSLRGLEAKIDVKTLLGEKLDIGITGDIDTSDLSKALTRAVTNNGTIISPKEFRPIIKFLEYNHKETIHAADLVQFMAQFSD